MDYKYVAVLLTVHNRKEKTLLCLSRLFSQHLSKCYKLEVYLTDDGCTDGTSEAIHDMFPETHIIQGDGNLYWNRGMYWAWEAASNAKEYDYYMWLNDDTVLNLDALELLISSTIETDEKDIIVGATTDKTKTTYTYGGRIRGVIPPANGNLIEVDSFNGNIVLVPQSVYKTVGNLDYYFTHGKGDFDYGLRARKLGIKLYQAGRVLGECEAHEGVDKWCNPIVPFCDRWKAMWKPNGMPPNETFHLERRHIGLAIASFHFFTILIRCIFPQLWLRIKQ